MSRRSALLLGFLLLTIAGVEGARAGSACGGGTLGTYTRILCDVDALQEEPPCPLPSATSGGLSTARAALVEAESSTTAAARRLRKRARRAVRRAARAARKAECSIELAPQVVAIADQIGTLLASTRALPGLPVATAGFATWFRLNAEPIPPRTGGDAHAGIKNVYVDRLRTEIAPGDVQQFPYPDGSIVVKAVTRPSEDFIYLVAVMRKRTGIDPAHGDWDFVEYIRRGPTARFEVVARDGVCWGCHAQVAPTSDWVFTLLE